MSLAWDSRMSFVNDRLLVLLTDLYSVIASNFLVVSTGVKM